MNIKVGRLLTLKFQGDKQLSTEQSGLNLVGGLEHVLFFHILGKITPTDELIFFREVVVLPPTSSKYVYCIIYIYNSRFFNTRKPKKKHGTFNVSVQTALRLALRVGSQETVVQVVHVVPSPGL